MSEKNHAAILTKAFDITLQKKYGSYIPPNPCITPLGIKHLDALLGGGITSSCPVAFSSTPETGKSTCSLYLCSQFLKIHENSCVIYLDTESAAGGESKDIEDRIETFGIDRERFLYKPFVMNVKEIFEVIEQLADLKKQMEVKTQKEYDILVVWDSIAATPSSKDLNAEDPNEVIGYKARELTFQLTKAKQFLAMHRITFIVIDQVRANMQIKAPWQAATDEKTVGTFGNFKSATNVSALQHNVRQWLWLSKGVQLKPTDPLGVDGWVLNVFTEKNKLAPSQYSIPLVFDKKYGIIPVLSEYYFMANKTKTEKKFWPDKKKMPYPLLINGATNARHLEVIDPNTGELMYSSEKFNERDFIKKYNSDLNFKQWFDYAATVSAQQRIGVMLFRTLYEQNLADSKDNDNTNVVIENEIYQNPIIENETYQNPIIENQQYESQNTISENFTSAENTVPDNENTESYGTYFPETSSETYSTETYSPETYSPDEEY